MGSSILEGFVLSIQKGLIGIICRKDLVLVGAGGHGREVLWQLIDANKRTGEYNILGFVDNAPHLQGKQVNGFPVIGDDQWLLKYPNEIYAVISIGSSKARKDIFHRLKRSPSIYFPTILSENVKCSDSVKIGQGCFVCLSSVLQANVTIGDFVVVNVACVISHDTVLEDFVTLNPSVSLAGNVWIGACTDIGTGATVIPGRHVGENTIIGAGSVVVKDIPSNCTALGVPAIPIKTQERLS